MSSLPFLLQCRTAGTLQSHASTTPTVLPCQQVFVRRCALATAAQVISHLPPARLAGAMLTAQQDAKDRTLVEQLQWVQEWAAAAAVADGDEHCRWLAAGCCALHAEMAADAMRAAEQLPEAGGSGGGDLVGRVLAARPQIRL
jgi:hypothetical protein